MNVLFEILFLIFIEFFFLTICGWIGHVVVRAITFGKVDLEWGAGSGSTWAEFIGLSFVFLLVGIIVWISYN